jgi:hypothetical protein
MELLIGSFAGSGSGFVSSCYRDEHKKKKHPSHYDNGSECLHSLFAGPFKLDNSPLIGKIAFQYDVLADRID